MQDASFLLTGSLYDADGTEIPLEIETQVMPVEEVGRAFFIQPDALADNFIVVDDDAVYNYLFLTNQVTVLDISDPDALGGLFPEAEARGPKKPQEEFDFSLNLDKLFLGWEMSVEGYSESPAGNVYDLRFLQSRGGRELRLGRRSGGRRLVAPLPARVQPTRRHGLGRAGLQTTLCAIPV